MNGEMTKEEKATIRILGDAWNMFLGLGNRTDSTDDTNDFRKAIHDAQRIIAYRAARRANEDILR